jgi:hypothetical protein
MSSCSVSLAVATAGFWVFGSELVTLETPTAGIEVSQPQEIALCVRLFDLLHQSALYGADART